MTTNPALFAPYSHRPAWSVAGVDTPVGPAAGVPMRPWRSLPIGGAVLDINPASGRVDIGPGVLAGIDFGGAWLYLSRPDVSAVLYNCRFGALPAGIPYCVCSQVSGACSLAVYNCDFDGSTPDQTGFIGWRGDGALTLEGNHFGERGQHVLEVVGGLTHLEYSGNLIDGGANNPGAHDNALQWADIAPGSTASVRGNTVVKRACHAGVLGGEVFQFYGMSGALASATCSRNVLIATGQETLSNFIHGGPCPKGLISENWYDTSGSLYGQAQLPAGFIYPGSAGAGWKVTGNINLLDGVHPIA